jgi:hypothetical protein
MFIGGAAMGVNSILAVIDPGPDRSSRLISAAWGLRCLANFISMVVAAPG